MLFFLFIQRWTLHCYKESLQDFSFAVVHRSWHQNFPLKNMIRVLKEMLGWFWIFVWIFMLIPASKYLAQQTSTYSKSVAETLKANSRDCASLLKTCSISKTLFKCFLVYYEHVFVYCDVFAVTISFLMYLLSILNRFHTLSTFICYQFCIESRRSHQRCSLRKGTL